MKFISGVLFLIFSLIFLPFIQGEDNIPREIDLLMIISPAINIPDGYSRSIIKVTLSTNQENQGRKINKFFPRSTIQIHNNQTLRITLVNQLSEPTGLHLHGIIHPNNPWMDGAYRITQCGIPPGGNFTYQIQLNPQYHYPGLYWYHSHYPGQTVDGFYGPLLLLDSTKMTDSGLDGILMIQDWYHQPANQLLIRMKGPYLYKRENILPLAYPFPGSSILINQVGQYNCSRMGQLTEQICLNRRIQEKLDCVPDPASYFDLCRPINSNQMTRLFCPNNRTETKIGVINTGASIPIRLWFPHSNMKIFRRDGINLIKKLPTYTSLTLGVGERAEILVNCPKKESIVPFWISTSPVYMPGQTPNHWSYGWFSSSKDRLTSPPLSPPDSFVNENGIFQPNISLNSTYFTDNITLEYSWQADPLIHPDLQISPSVKYSIYLPHGAYSYSHKDRSEPLEVWYFETSRGKISFINPVEPPLLSWFETQKIIQNNWTFLPEEEMEYYSEQQQSIWIEDKPLLGPMTYRLKYQERYQIILLSYSGQQHPWHLHNFQVEMIGVGYLNDTNKTSREIYTQLLLRYPLNQSFPILTITDTWMTPPQGYSVFRFNASQLGPYLFHCHVEWHLSQGMNLIFSVENEDGYFGIDPPPNNFPLDCLSSRSLSTKKSNQLFNDFLQIILIIIPITISIIIITVIIFSFILDKRREGYSPIPIEDTQEEMTSHNFSPNSSNSSPDSTDDSSDFPRNIISKSTMLSSLNLPINPPNPGPVLCFLGDRSD